MILSSLQKQSHAIRGVIIATSQEVKRAIFLQAPFPLFLRAWFATVVAFAAPETAIITIMPEQRGEKCSLASNGADGKKKLGC